MGIFNINTLQNKLSYSNILTGYDDVYLKQSLANLGQRIGVQGDGICVERFSITDVLTYLPTTSQYYVKASYVISSGIVEFSAYVENQTSQISQEIDTSYMITSSDLMNFADSSQKYASGGKIEKIDEDDYFCMFKTQSLSNGSSTVFGVDIDENKNLKNGILFNSYGTYVISHSNSSVYSINTYSPVNNIETEVWNILLNDIFEIHSTNDIEIDLLESVSYISNCNSVLNSTTHQFDQNGSMFNTNTIFTNANYSWLDAVKEEYNKIHFPGTDNNKQLKQEIVSMLVKSMYDEAKTTVSEKFDVYFPNEYQFVVGANSNDHTQYYGNLIDIVCTFVAEPDFNKRILFAIGVQDSNVKMIDYNFTIEYYENSKVLDTIHIYKDLVLPYINNEGNWTINNIDTGYKAKGDDAGKPNIIITYTTYSDNTQKPTLLSAVQGDILKDYFNSTSDCLIEKQFKYKSFIKNGDSSEVEYEFTNKLPLLNGIPENLRQFVEDSLVVSLIDIKESSIAEQNLKDGYLCTFWRYVENEPTIITSPKSPLHALSVNDITNISSIISYYLSQAYTPDRYYFNHLVHTGISTAFKNNTVNTVDRLSPVFRNLDDTKYVGTASDEEHDAMKSIEDYHNPLNFTIEYRTASSIQESESTKEIIGITDNQDTKYFKITEDSGLHTYSIGNITHYTDYPYEFIPNSYYDANNDNFDYYPTIDLKETFIRNENLLNRLNIIDFEKESASSHTGKIYYAYLGASYEDPTSTIHLGTSNKNINIGTTTLTASENISKFNKIKEFDIDIDKIVNNGVSYFVKDTYRLNGSLDWKYLRSEQLDIYYTDIDLIGIVNNSDNETLFGYDSVYVESKYFGAYLNKYYIRIKQLFKLINVPENSNVITDNENTNDRIYLINHRLSGNTIYQNSSLKYGGNVHIIVIWGEGDSIPTVNFYENSILTNK